MKEHKNNPNSDLISRNSTRTTYHDKAPTISPLMSCLSSSGKSKPKELNPRLNLRIPLLRKPLTYWTRQSTMVGGTKLNYLGKKTLRIANNYFAALSQLKSLQKRLSNDIQLKLLYEQTLYKSSKILCQASWNAAARTREILVFASSPCG